MRKELLTTKIVILAARKESKSSTTAHAAIRRVQIKTKW